MTFLALRWRLLPVLEAGGHAPRSPPVVPLSVSPQRMFHAQVALHLPFLLGPASALWL